MQNGTNIAAPNPMVVNLDAFNAGRNNFRQQYFLDQCNTSFGGQETTVSWSAISNAVSQFIGSTGCSAETVALRFVHCYDPTMNSLYLRMQICTMEASGTPNVYNLVTDPCAWYQIYNGQLTTTTDTTLRDDNYFTYFYYCTSAPCSEETLQNLADDTSLYVCNQVLPWSIEIQKMFSDNNGPQGAILCFAACSYAQSSGVGFPHALYVFLRNAQGVAMIDNQTYPNAFQMKACDMGTLCPAHCDVYVSC